MKRLGAKVGGIVCVALVALICLLILYSRDQKHAPVIDGEVLADYRRFYPKLINTSPNGDRYLERLKRPGAAAQNGLVVRDIEDRRITNLTFCAAEPVRPLWSPNGDMVAFFLPKADSILRELYIWNLDSDKQSRLDIPESFNQPEVRWSPDGRYLGFISSPGILVVVDTIHNSFAVSSEKVSFFDWSSDSQQIITCDATLGHEHEIKIVSINSLDVVSTASIELSGLVSEVAWHNSDSFLVLSSEENENEARAFYRLRQFEPDGSNGQVILSRESNTREVSWLPGGRRLLFQQQDGGATHRIFVRRADGGELKALNDSGSVHFRGFQNNGQWLNAIEYRQSKHQLIKINLNNYSVESVAIQSGFRMDDIVHERVLVDPAVPILVSKVVGPRSRNAVVIRMHGGASMSLANERWAETQLLLKRGVSVIHVENRRPFGASDLLLACDYAREVMGIPRERTVLLGASTAAAIVIEAAATRPDSAGSLAVVGLGSLEIRGVLPKQRHRFRIFGFHGRNDPDPAVHKARERLQDWFGKKALSPPRGCYLVLDDERHSLMHDESNASVYTMILRSFDH